MGNKCAGERKEFKWRIEGFSSLLQLESQTLLSGGFEAGGYKWKLHLNPKKLMTDDGKSYISLFLGLAHPSSLPLDMAVKAVFKLQIYDQIHGKHHKMKVKFIRIRDYKLKPRRVTECLSVKKEMISGTYVWNIKEFLKLPALRSSSESFVVGHLKWHINLYPGRFNTDGGNHLSIFLVLEDSVKHGVYVEFSLLMRDQVNGEHKKLIGQGCFDSKNRACGFLKLLSHKDFFNPSKGFLVENGCIIETCVTIVGSVCAS